VLELKSIAVRLGTFEIHDISLEVAAGEYVILLGPSGVGKTVLIETVAGLIRPCAGRVFFQGVDITSLRPEQREFAIVYQDYALFPHLTVKANIAYGLRSAGIERSEKRRRTEQLADLLGISQLLRRRPEGLSGGEQQRVALARALAIRPKMLLLDEPLSSLDSNTRIQLRKELKRVNKELGISILHVTHDQEEAMVLGDRIAVMLDFRIRQTASSDKLFRRPSDVEVARFVGLRNIFEVESVADGACMVLGERIHASSATQDTSHIWIGPEEVLLSREPFQSSARNQFQCEVLDWNPQGSLLMVHVKTGGIVLAALITHSAFDDLQITPCARVYATFKSSAVHCF